MADTGQEHPSESPLIEAIAGDDDHVLATVFWRGSADRVAVLGGLGGWEVEPNLMTRGGSLWRGSYRIARDLRTTYVLLPDPPDEVEFTPELFRRLELDPLNSQRWVCPADEEDPEWGFEDVRSLLEGPEAPPQRWIHPLPGTPAGTTELHRLRSGILGNERRVWVHLPAAYDPGERYGVLVVFDGWAYVHLVPTPTILDNLIAARALPPLVAVMPDSLDQETRSRELPCHPPFVDFLVKELLPWARERWTLTDDPARIAVAGSSFGGLAAVFAAFSRPECFGNALSQSGTFGWGAEGGRESECLTAEIEAVEPRPFRVWLEVGSLETGQRPAGGPSAVASNRRLQGVLERKAYRACYAEFSGAHDYVCWRGTLADGLIALLGRSRELGREAE